MGKFRQFLGELFAHEKSILSFPNNYLSRCQWIFTKLDTCIDIIEICFGLLIGKICQF